MTIRQVLCLWGASTTWHSDVLTIHVRIESQAVLKAGLPAHPCSKSLVVLAVIRAAIVKLHLGRTHEERLSEEELGMNRRQGPFVAVLGVALMAGEANNNWGPIVANGDQIAPNTAIATYTVRKDFLAKNRDVVIRWSIAYLQGVREFNAAAQAPDQHPDIVEILAKNTALNKPELVRTIAPNWVSLP